MQFRIDLMDTSEGGKKARERLKYKISRLASKLLNEDAARKDSNHARVERYVADLIDARHWDILAGLDGRFFPKCMDDRKEEQAAEEAVKAREWALRTFRDTDIEQLMNLAVNIALLKPYETGRPGNSKGHTNLLEQLVEHKNSIFAGALTPALRKRFVSMAFWEQLPDLSRNLNGGWAYRRIERILKHDELSSQFAEEGLKMANKTYPTHMPAPELAYLSDDAIDRFDDFGGAISISRVPIQLQETFVKLVVSPYTRVAIGLTGEDWERKIRFPQGGERRGYLQRLNGNLVRPYKNNQEARNALVDEIVLNLEYGTGITSEIIASYVSAISAFPNPRELRTRIEDKITTEKDNRKEFTKLAVSSGIN